MTIDRNIPEFRGLYGIPEAALYLRSTPPLTNGHTVATANLRYWIRTGVSPIAPTGFPSRRRFISFRDLITMRLVAILRFREMDMADIRKTEIWMKENTHIDWPFVWRPLWTFGSHAFTEFGDRLVAASKFGQQAMEFVREWLSEVELDMTFDANDLAETWSPYPGVRINPAIRLGEPCIDGSRIPTETVWGKIKAGDSIKVVSTLYGLSELQIEQAVKWEERLLSAKS